MVNSRRYGTYTNTMSAIRGCAEQMLHKSDPMGFGKMAYPRRRQLGSVFKGSLAGVTWHNLAFINNHWYHFDHVHLMLEVGVWGHAQRHEDPSDCKATGENFQEFVEASRMSMCGIGVVRTQELDGRLDACSRRRPGSTSLH